MNALNSKLTNLHIDKLVYGGQGLGVSDDGTKAFVWGALPGETVNARIIKRKRSYIEAVAEEITTSSPDRIEAAEPDVYLSTSPWQILEMEVENAWKQKIVEGLFEHSGLKTKVLEIASTKIEYHYRNKMEYAFYGDEEGLHLALHVRGSHHKKIVKSSALAHEKINKIGTEIINMLNKISVRAADLKSIIIRTSEQGSVVALYTKVKNFPTLELPTILTGLGVYYSDPRSPASVITDTIYELGSLGLSDVLLGRRFHYDVHSFFQVNVEAYELALRAIKSSVGHGHKILDMYGGTGSIGISLDPSELVVVDIDKASINHASHNMKNNKIRGRAVCSKTEKALEEIDDKHVLILDPPRAGLHPKVVDRIIEILPQTVVYLSCNPATQVRDLLLLSDFYNFSDAQLFNFFPRTPHIEALVIMTKK